jgi:hypothetical protein
MDHARRLAQWVGMLHRVGSDLSYWLIIDSSKIISKTSVEHVTPDDYLQTDKKEEIDKFSQKIDESRADANFAIEGEGGFDSMYLDDINDDMNPGVAILHGRFTWSDDTSPEAFSVFACFPPNLPPSTLSTLTTSWPCSSRAPKDTVSPTRTCPEARR